MPADRVVEHLDVIEHVRGSHGACRVDPPLDPLLLQYPEEALGHGIVVAVPAAAHARHHPVRFQERLPVAAGELTALIRMQQHTWARLAPPSRRHQRLQYQITGHRRRRRPTDDLPRVQIHHRRPEQPALAGPDIGDVRDSDFVRCLWCEIPVEHVGHHAHGASAIARLAAIADLVTHTFCLHQPQDAVPAAVLSASQSMSWLDIKVAARTTCQWRCRTLDPEEPAQMAWRRFSTGCV